MNSRRLNDEKVEMNMSSLIDCVFLLLIFFLVATMTKKENRDIDVDLPVSTSSLEIAPDDNTMVIGITSDKKIFFNGRPCSINELSETLSTLAEEAPETRLRLDCDRDTPFRRIVEVLDLCAFRGLRNVGVRTYDEKYNQ